MLMPAGPTKLSLAFWFRNNDKLYKEKVDTNTFSNMVGISNNYHNIKPDNKVHGCILSFGLLSKTGPD